MTDKIVIDLQAQARKEQDGDDHEIITDLSKACRKFARENGGTPFTAWAKVVMDDRDLGRRQNLYFFEPSGA